MTSLLQVMTSLKVVYLFLYIIHFMLISIADTGNKPHFWIRHIHTDSHWYAQAFVLLIWHGFWKYLVCFAGSFGVYFSNEKLQQLPHIWSRILFFLIKITNCRNSEKSYPNGCTWEQFCAYLQESITFCLTYIQQNIVRSLKALEKAVVMMYIENLCWGCSISFAGFKNYRLGESNMTSLLTLCLACVKKNSTFNLHTGFSTVRSTK